MRAWRVQVLALAKRTSCPFVSLVATLLFVCSLECCSHEFPPTKPRLVGALRARMRAWRVRVLALAKRTSSRFVSLVATLLLVCGVECYSHELYECPRTKLRLSEPYGHECERVLYGFWRWQNRLRAPSCAWWRLNCSFAARRFIATNVTNFHECERGVGGFWRWQSGLRAPSCPWWLLFCWSAAWSIITTRVRCAS
jgi:hypothetical protein